MLDGGRKFKFSKPTLEALPLPEPGKKVRYRDTKVNGLAVLVTGNGSKAFYLYRRYQGKLYEKQIGTCDDLSVEQARRKAEEWIGQLTRGQEPGQVKRKKDPTFAELFEWFMEIHGRKAKDGGARRRMQFGYLEPLARKQAIKVSRSDVITLQERITEEVGAPTANRAVGLMRAVYNQAIDREAFNITTNPAKKIAKADEGRGRERRLEHREIGPFLDAADAEPVPDIKDLILVALFTGARRSNVLGMRWDQIDPLTQAWTIPDEDFKTGEAHIVPLPKLVQGILEARRTSATGTLVFPGKGQDGKRTSPYHSLKRLLDRAGIQGFTFHDLRRTCATYMGEAGVDQYLIKRVLGHTVADVTGIYNRPGLEARREALEKGIALMLDKAGRPRRDDGTYPLRHDEHASSAPRISKPPSKNNLKPRKEAG